MSTSKSSIRLYISLLIGFLWLTLATFSHSQSLIGNENIKNFQPNASVDVVINVGSGNCETVISNIKLGGKKLLVRIDKPIDCTFNTLDLMLGDDILPLQGLSDAFEMDAKNYKLRENINNGELFFEAKNSITSEQIKNIKIRETFCKGGHCLTSTNLVVSSQPRTVTQQQPGAFMGGMFGGQITPRNSIAYNNDGTIIGHDGIIWRRCALGRDWDLQNRTCKGEPVKAAWLNMVELASKDTFGGFNDWRLPTEAEFSSLVGKQQKCSDLRQRLSELFPGVWSGVMFGSHHWLLDNSAEMTDPSSTNLEPSSFGCSMTNKDLRVHASQPAIFVRGGTVSSAWSVAVSKTSQTQAVFDQSKKAGVAYWNGVDSKINDFFSSGANASSGASSNSGSNSKSSGATAIRSETYDNAGRKTEGYWVKCGGGSETRVYRTAWDNNRSWYRPGGGNGYFVADGGLTINDVAQRICK